MSRPLFKWNGLSARNILVVPVMLLFIVAMLIQVSCNQSPQPPLPLVVVPSRTPIPITVVVSPTSPPDPTVTASPEPTLTGVPEIVRATIVDNVVYLGERVILDTAVSDFGCFDIREITYSPDDTYFIVVLNCFEGDNEAFSFRNDGNDMRRITNQWDYINNDQYEWSADGQYFVYQRINSCCADIPPDAPLQGIVQYHLLDGEKLEPKVALETATPAPEPQIDASELRPLAESGIVRLTFGGASHYTPIFAPDQQRLVLTVKVDGHWQVAETDANGYGQIRQITQGSDDYFQPQYSADGKTILVAANLDGDSDIYLIDAQSGAVVQQLTNGQGNEYHPRWLADGSGFIFTGEWAGNDEVYLGRMDGSSIPLTDYAGFDGFASVSPDGQQVVFYSLRDGDYEIYVMDIDGRNPKRLTTNNGRDASPSFSPDGEWIVYEREYGNYDIYVMRRDGSERRQLTYSPAGDWVPSFSPDGLWILFQSDRTGFMDIYRLPFLSRTLFLDDPFMIGGDVKLVQERLLALGYTEVGVVDSLFGAWTEAAVKAFQADNDLVVDGVVNPATWDVLFELTE